MTPLFVLHWNRPDECIATVRAFLAQEFPIAPCVVDNGSTADNIKRLEGELPSAVKIVRLPRNVGWGAAFNEVLGAWVKSADDYCLISAHDALPESGCVQKLEKAMAGDRRLGMACPEFGDGSVLRFSPWRGIYVETVPRGAQSTLEYMPAPHGTLAMFRRQCLKEIGLYDERYFAYGDETEIGLRAARSGWRSAMIWGAVVRNPGTWTPKPVVSYLFARNSLLTVRIYGGPVRAWLRLLLKCLVLGRDQHGLFAGWPVMRARWRGMLDFCLGRLGAPPAELMAGAPASSRPA